MNPPFRTYDGGKGGEGVWQRIISEMPPHRVYFEPFLGNSPIMARKASAALNIGYDLDASVVKAWRSSASESAIAPEASPFATNGDVTHYRFWCGDGIPALESREWSGEECVYADPPYLMDSRSCKDRMYKFEMGPDVHHRLLDVLLTLPCPVLLSSYDNPLYRSRLAGWRVVEIPTVNRRGKRTLELLWCNFTAPLALHDYRFLGRNFRERERITRRQKRWRRRLLGLPFIERAALLSSLAAAESHCRLARKSDCSGAVTPEQSQRCSCSFEGRSVNTIYASPKQTSFGDASPSPAIAAGPRRKW